MSLSKTTLRKMACEYLSPFMMRQLLKVYGYMNYIICNDKKAFHQNKQLKDQGKGKRAFLLATGPSIKLEDLTVLKDEDCFSLSNFFLHKDLNIIKPKYHFFCPYHQPLVLSNFVDWLKQADQTLPPETSIILGHSDKELVEKYELFPNRHITYLFLQPMLPHKVDITKPVTLPQTGPLMVIPVLLYMGYTEIYLLGCDHTVLRDYKKHSVNFYKKENDSRKNATDPNSWGDIMDEMTGHVDVFKQYLYYKEMAEKQNTTIINLSQDSWLSYFSFEKLSNLFPHNSLN